MKFEMHSGVEFSRRSTENSLKNTVAHIDYLRSRYKKIAWWFDHLELQIWGNYLLIAVGHIYA